MTQRSPAPAGAGRGRTPGSAGARRRRRWAGVLLGPALLIWACTDDEPSATPVTTAVPTVPTTVPSDGVLRLGVLVPLTGQGAALGTSLASGAQLAVDAINAADGVMGADITIEIHDEGGDATTAAASLDALLDAGVDGIIGPASSNIAFQLLGRATEDNLLVCSPTATAIGLADLPDRDLFFRTVPSDALQAAALAKSIELSGTLSVAVLAPDDSYGEAFALALESRLGDIQLPVTVSLRYDPTSEDLGPLAAEAVAGEPGAVAVIGSGDGGASMLAALHAAGASSAEIFVNDALQDPGVAAALGDNAAEILAGVRGTAVRARPISMAFTEEMAARFPDVSANFAGYAYDCVNAIALAAVAADSDAAAKISQQLVAVTTSGDLCGTFADCAGKLKANLNVDLVGVSGTVDINRFGDVSEGVFERFRFDEVGRPQPVDQPLSVPT